MVPACGIYTARIALPARAQRGGQVAGIYGFADSHKIDILTDLSLRPQCQVGSLEHLSTESALKVCKTISCGSDGSQGTHPS